MCVFTGLCIGGTKEAPQQPAYVVGQMLVDRLSKHHALRIFYEGVIIHKHLQRENLREYKTEPPGHLGRALWVLLQHYYDTCAVVFRWRA